MWEQPTRGRRQQTSQDPRRWKPSWLRDACASEKDPGPDQALPSKTTGQRQPGNEPHSHKTGDCEPRGRAGLLGSLPLLLSAPAPLPNKVSCFVRSPWIIHFPVSDKNPVSGPGRRPPFCTTLVWEAETSHGLLPASWSLRKVGRAPCPWGSQPAAGALMTKFGRSWVSQAWQGERFALLFSPALKGLEAGHSLG